jgi:hypothetical protein
MFKGLKKDSIRRASSRSSKWLQNKIDTLSDRTKTARPASGDMFLYVYDAKYKDTLPFWDAHPLIIMLNKAEGGYYGLNLHYLPPKLRIVFLEELLKIDSSKASTMKTNAAKATILRRASKTKFFAPMIKRYLFSHVRSKFVKIPQEEWFNVATLPVANWKKSTAPKAYADSRRKL